MRQETLEKYRDDAREAAARSHSLWQCVNQAIVEALDAAIRDGHSRKRVYATLMRMAGRQHAGEPVAVGNFRSAARQIANRADRLTLI